MLYFNNLPRLSINEDSINIMFFSKHRNDHKKLFCLILTILFPLILFAGDNPKKDLIALIGEDQTLSLETQNKKLITAAIAGELEEIQDLVENGVDIDYTMPENGGTALICAVQNRRKNIVRFLLQKLANPNAALKPLEGFVHHHGSTALHLAVFSKDVDIVKLLVEDTRTDVNLVRNHDGASALHCAVNFEQEKMVKTLVGKGKADIDQKTHNGSTPLHLALLKNDKKTARFLIESKADIHLTDEEGNTPLHLAARINATDLVRLLADDKTVNVTNQKGETALFRAVVNNFIDTANYLISMSAIDLEASPHEDNATPLFVASEHGCIPIIKKLISAGAKVNASAKTGESPLISACAGGRKKAAKILLKHGAEIDHTTHKGVTALLYAIDAGKSDVVNLLISKGANILIADGTGVTPLQKAQQRKYKKIINMLEKALANGSINGVLEPPEIPAYQKQGYESLYTQTPILIDTTKRYRLNVRVRQTRFAGKPIRFYAGIVCLNGAYEHLKPTGGWAAYCAASNVILSEKNRWVTYSGVISGVNLSVNNSFVEGTTAIRPLCLINYQKDAAMVEISCIELWDIDKRTQLIDNPRFKKGITNWTTERTGAFPCKEPAGVILQ